jgi:hypothetical protein
VFLEWPEWWAAYALEAQDFENFQGMVNKALVLENRRGVMERKRKLVRQHQSDSSSRPRVATSSAGQGFSTPQRQGIQRPNNLQTSATGN